MRPWLCQCRQALNKYQQLEIYTNQLRGGATRYISYLQSISETTNQLTNFIKGNPFPQKKKKNNNGVKFDIIIKILTCKLIAFTYAFRHVLVGTQRNTFMELIKTILLHSLDCLIKIYFILGEEFRKRHYYCNNYYGKPTA